MRPTVCFDRDTFYFVITAGVMVILYVLYTIYQQLYSLAIEKLSMKDQLDEDRDRYQETEIRRLELAQANQLNTDVQRMTNPFVPPVQRGPFSAIGAAVTTPVNIPTRGEYGAFQQVGYLASQDDIKHSMPLMGRRIHSNQYEYYTFHHKNPHIKIPLKPAGNQEITDGKELSVPGYSDDFTAKIYELDYPRYIPY